VMDTRSSSSTSVEHAVFASYGFPRQDAAARRFAAQYRSRFGRDPVGSFAGLGLETIRLLEGAVRQAGSAQPRAIQQAIYRGMTLHGVGLANRTYEPGNHNPIGPVSIRKVVEGSLEPVEASVPSGAAPP
jgi:ABC-type branched-subunit amino acid transport system substrate-binding protein